MTPQDREIICRAAAQDLAGVLEIVSAVVSGKISASVSGFSPTPALDTVRSMSKQEQIDAIALHGPRVAKALFKQSRPPTHKKRAA